MAGYSNSLLSSGDCQRQMSVLLAAACLPLTSTVFQKSRLLHDIKMGSVLAHFMGLIVGEESFSNGSAAAVCRTVTRRTATKPRAGVKTICFTGLKSRMHHSICSETTRVICGTSRKRGNDVCCFNKECSRGGNPDTFISCVCLNKRRELASTGTRIALKQWIWEACANLFLPLELLFGVLRGFGPRRVVYLAIE